MTPKRKPKNQNPIVDQFFNNILFVKGYTFETSLPLQTVTERLYGLKDEKSGWLIRRSRYFIEIENLYGQANFDIRAKDRQHRYTITHATGTAYSSDNGGTVVEGEIRFGVVYFLMFMLSILWVVFIFQYFGLGFSAWLIGFALISPTFTFGHMLYKRQQLINSIQTAITPRMSDSTLPPPQKRKGLHEIYGELQEEYGNFAVEPTEKTDYDQR